MKTNQNILLLAFAVILFASCATPRAVIRMNPVAENVKWFYGQAFASDTLSGIEVEAAFEQATDEYNIFNVGVTNNSNMDFLVDPALIYFEEITSDSINTYKIKSIDPEFFLLNIDKEISKNEADVKNARVGGAIVAGTLVAATVVLAVTDKNDHFYTEDALTVGAPLIINGANYDEEYLVCSLDHQRELWATSTIRKTTLEPGYKIEGKVFFPRFEKPGFYNLRIPVDEGAISIPFVQIHYYPNAN